MLKNIKLFILAMAMLALSACGGGGGNRTQSGDFLTHREAAEEFVTRLNLDLGYDVELIKYDTLQFGHIVVYDWLFETYDSYDINGWVVGQNMANFVATTTKFFDLDPIGGNVFEDWDSGLQFSKKSLTETQANLAFHAAKFSKADNVAELINQKYGVEMSVAKAKAPMLVEFALNRESMSDGEIDEFTEALVGHTWTDIAYAQKKGADALNELFESSTAKDAILDADYARNLLGI